MANQLEQWYASIPTVTRVYLTLTLAVTVGCALEVGARATISSISFMHSCDSLTTRERASERARGRWGERIRARRSIAIDD